MNTLLSLNFWFNLKPLSLSPFFVKAFFVAFAAFVIFGAIANIVAKRKKDDRLMVRAYRKLAQIVTVMGWLGFFLLFVGYEEIYFFAARFWYLVWAAGLVYWFYTLYRYLRFDIPRIREEQKHLSDVNKYLPRRAR